MSDQTSQAAEPNPMNRTFLHRIESLFGLDPVSRSAAEIEQMPDYLLRDIGLERHQLDLTQSIDLHRF